jgi:hypothetical protein
MVDTATTSAPTRTDKAVAALERMSIPAKAHSHVSARRLEEFQNKLDARLNHRREQWEREDSELRSVMAAAGGGDWDSLMGRLGVRQGQPRDLSEMSGRQGRLDWASGRSIAARFDTALTTDDNRLHWAMADGLAADAAANPMIRYTLRNRSRYEIANNCYARGVGLSIANDFVGTGPRLHIEDERLTEDEQADVEAKFAAWSAAINLPGKLRTMRMAKRQDGEAFACKITNPNLPCPVKLDLRVIEADQVRFVDIQLLLVPSVDGIRFDDYGNPVSYHILRVHPGYWSYATGYIGFPWEYDVWDAQYVIHWFRQDRPGQHRGIPELLPALPLYATLRRWTMATLDAAETAADFAVLLETQAGAMAYDEDGNQIPVGLDEATPFSAVGLHRRMIAALPSGYSAKQMQPMHPGQEYGAFKEQVAGEIGRCENVPKNMVLGDSSNSNFSSGQLDHRIYFRTRELERDEANRLILESLLKDWIAMGVRAREGNGDYGKPYLPAVLRDLGTGVEHSWYWDSNEMGDPLKLAAAHGTNLKNGTETIPGIYEAKGQNWIRKFKSNARALGVTFSEIQELVRNSIFASSGTEPVDASKDEGGTADKPPPTVKRPAQGATRRATSGAAA